MNEIKKVKKQYKDEDIISFPVYMPYGKYKQFIKYCKDDRLALTKVAESEIDKYIARKRRIENSTPEITGTLITD